MKILNLIEILFHEEIVIEKVTSIRIEHALSTFENM